VLGLKPPRGFKGRVLTIFTSGAYEGVERRIAVVQNRELRLENI